MHAKVKWWKTDTSLPLYGKGVQVASSGMRYLDGAAAYSYVGSDSDDKEGAGPRSRAAYHEGKATYIDLGRKEAPSVGRSHKGRLH
jgi:hypothetical protein